MWRGKELLAEWWVLPICSNYLPISVNEISWNIFYFPPFCGWTLWEGISLLVLPWHLHLVAVRCLLGPQSSETLLGGSSFTWLGPDTSSQVELVSGCRPEHTSGPSQHGCLRVARPLTWQLLHTHPQQASRKDWVHFFWPNLRSHTASFDFTLLVKAALAFARTQREGTWTLPLDWSMWKNCGSLLSNCAFQTVSFPPPSLLSSPFFCITSLLSLCSPFMPLPFYL